jgi:hypothetical protein
LYEYGKHKPELLLQALDSSHHKSGAVRETTEALHFSSSLATNIQSYLLHAAGITGCVVVVSDIREKTGEDGRSMDRYRVGLEETCNELQCHWRNDGCGQHNADLLAYLNH